MVKINNIISLLAASAFSLVAGKPAESFVSQYESDFCKELDSYLHSKDVSLVGCSTADDFSSATIQGNTITQDIIDKINAYDGTFNIVVFEKVTKVEKNLDLSSLKSNALYFDNKHLEYTGEKKDIYIPENVLKTAKTITSLSIDGFNLSQKNINEITTLTKLNELYLEDCTADLDMDYEKLKNLKNLTDLVLSTVFQKGQEAEYLDEVPESICQLKNLKYLSLYRNDITDLPECMKNLKNLERLDLRLNDIEEDDIPKAIKELPKLEIMFE